jgi:hypothetical protein
MIPVLDRYFKIFEGADDSKFRSIALDIYKKTLEALKGDGRRRLTKSKAGKPITTVNLGELLKNPELDNLEMWFIAKPPVTGTKTFGRFIPGSSTRPNRIELNVYAKSDLPTPEKFHQVLADGGAVKVLESAREVFWHEFVHFMDSERIGPEKMKDLAKSSSSKAKTRDVKGYYNDPLEYNAFVQQGLTKIDHFLQGKTPEQAKSLIGKDANEFYKLVLQVIPSDMRRVMTDTYKQKLKKRVAQMWSDLTRSNDGRSTK